MPRAQWGKLRDYPASLKTFADAGYELWHLQGVTKGRNFGSQDWATAPLPPLRSVSAAKPPHAHSHCPSVHTLLRASACSHPMARRR